MSPAFALALCLVAQPAAAPALHEVPVKGGSYWVWAVKTPEGRLQCVRPEADAAPAAEPDAPSTAYQTNGVVASKLVGEGPVVHASDPETLAEAEGVIEAARRRQPSRPCGPDGPCKPDDDRADQAAEAERLLRLAARGTPWNDYIAYGLCVVLALAAYALVTSARRPTP